MKFGEFLQSGGLGDFGQKIFVNFVAKDRWHYLTSGLITTLEITALALIVGVIIGVVVALVRSTHDNTGKLKILNAIAKLYLTVIRGTPTMVQILIIYFGIFASVNVPKILVATIAFGLNSGAYVAEIIRGGIMSVDNGQYEAGRAMGFNYFKTMRYVVLPQAFKSVLPALGNEFIVLLKETSIAGYIAMDDITKGANIIRSQTYNALLPLTAAALIYLGLVMLISKLISVMERRLRASDH